MYCVKCQLETKIPGAVYCRRCGNQLVEAPFAQEMPAYQTSTNIPVYQTLSGIPAYQASASEHTEANVEIPEAKKRHVPLWLIAVLIVVGGFVFCWFYLDLDISDLTHTFGKDAGDSISSDEQDSGHGIFSDNNNITSDFEDPSNDDLLQTPNETSDAMPIATPVPRAEPSDTTVVLRNAHPNGRLFVDGVETNFDYVGDDIVVQRSRLSDVCQVRIVSEKDGAYETAAVWFNKNYGNELSFDADYGEYVPSDASGLGKPSEKVINVLIWAYHESFLRCINEQTSSLLRYSTAQNTYAENDHIFSTANSRNTYDLDNFSANCDASSITYSNNGTATFNATFVSYATNRTSGKKAEVVSRKTMEIKWEDGMWKINRLAFVNDKDYAAGRYADLP